MKEFLKYVFATVAGIGLFIALATVIGFVSLIGMGASEQVTASVKRGSVLRINLTGELMERAGETDPMSLLLGDFEPPLGLDQLKAAIAEAATNDKVAGIYLEVGTGFLGAAPAMLQELRQSLLEYKESGKWIIAYGDIYSQGAYYLSSVADTLAVNPEGIIDWHGLAAVNQFMAETLDKLGIKMQVFKVGTFKSAVEPFILTEMSEANRAQVTSYLGSIWRQMTEEVGASRGLTPAQLNVIADTLTAMQPTTYLTESGLADTLLYIDGFKEMLRQRLALKEKKDIPFVSPADLLASAKSDDEDDRVAVYYAYGDIVDDVASGLLPSTETQIVTMPTLRELQKLRKDDDVKAVVIRVNSPGGSAFASEQIWREISLLKAAKPVVVSMGGYAASGGYYISCGASKIIAEPTTLTGSIGIFGMIPQAEELLTQRAGLHFDVVKTNRYSDFGGGNVMGLMARPFTPEEGRLLQSHVERGYDLFTRRVAEGRSLSQDSVDAIGQGRVWTGEQAMNLGLVDALGNLDDAIEEAARLAELEEYSVDEYPGEPSWMDKLKRKGGDSYFDSRLRSTLGEAYPIAMQLQQMLNASRLDQCIYARLPFGLEVR